MRLRIHPLFVAALVVAAWGGWLREAALLLAVLLTHEAAHLVAAHAYQLEIIEIELLPYGGVARIAGLAVADPGVEALVALAGPMNNLILLALGWSAANAGILPYDRLQMFMALNASMAGFNLIPALPLDGGRLLRASLTPRLGFGAATHLALFLGRQLAWLLILATALLAWAGWFVPGLAIFAYLIWTTTASERWLEVTRPLRQLWQRGLGGGKTRVMAIRPLVATADATVGEALRHLAPRRFHLIWVVDDSLRVMGVLDEAQLERAYEESGPKARLGDFLRG